MTDERSFLRTYRNSLDLTVLLVFADWLEERGDGRCNILRRKVASTLRGIESWKRLALEGNKKSRSLGVAAHEKIAAWLADLYRWVRNKFKPGWRTIGRGLSPLVVAAGAKIVKQWREEAAAKVG